MLKLEKKKINCGCTRRDIWSTSHCSVLNRSRTRMEMNTSHAPGSWVMLKMLHFLWHPRMNRNLLTSVLLQQHWSRFISIKFIHLKIKQCKSKNNFSFTKRMAATSHVTQEQTDFYSHRTRHCLAQLGFFHPGFHLKPWKIYTPCTSGIDWMALIYFLRMLWKELLPTLLFTSFWHAVHKDLGQYKQATLC